MVKNIPQRIREKILLHNPNLSEREKRYLELYGAVNKYSLKTILTNTSDLSDWEQRIIRECIYKERPAEQQEVIKKLKARALELPEPDTQEKREE